MRAEIVFSAVFLAASSPETPGAAPASRRADLAPLASVLDTAVAKVARPVAAAGTLPGRSGARAYRLPGYGAMIVLSPRVLPASRQVTLRVEAPAMVTMRDAGAAKAIEEAVRSIQESIDSSSGVTRRALERSLEKLQAEQKRLTDSQARVEFRAQKMELVTPEEIEDLQREMQATMAQQAEALSQLEAGEREVHENRALRAHLAAVQAQAEALREEAERTRELAEQEVRIHLAPEAPTPPAPVAAPAPAPAPPAVPAPAAPPAELPEVPEAPAPPWQFWFQERRASRDSRTPDKVVAEVKDALASALAQPRAALTGLAPEDTLVVAVDLQAQAFSPRPRAERSLQARVRVKDVLARRAGTLTPEAFRQKVVFEEE